MTPRSFFLSPELAEYVQASSTAPDEVAASLIERTAALGGVSQMQVAPDQGLILGLLTSAIAPALAVEIGTFTGYSSLSIARHLPAGGRLLCCDVSEEWTAIAREHWEAAGVDGVIDLRIAPALETLEALPADTVIDFAFIDADKTGYRAYYEQILPRLSDRGLIAVDNTLWGGQVLDAGDSSDDTAALREFNTFVAQDSRAEVVLATLGDGLTLIRRR